MKIYVRALVDGDLILEEVDADPVIGYDSIAIVKSGKWWNIYDVPTGLKILSATTKKLAIENLYIKRWQVENVRKTELYQRRIKEFEEMKKL